MHGFNQGAELLKSYCSNALSDFMLLQELWLSSDSLYKLDTIAQGYSCFSVSSMDSVLENGLLRGRPFGGLAILVRENHRNLCSLLDSNERLIAVVYNDILIINVYFPCSSRLNYKDETLDLLVQIEELLDRFVGDKVIIGGDLNCTLEIESWSSNLIRGFSDDHNFISCNNLPIDVTGTEYTYSNEVLGHYSYLDYFVVSSNLSSSILSLKIGCDELNLSDHSPVSMEAKNIINVDYKKSNSNSNKGDQISETCYHNRWDHADIVGYYKSTGVGLQPVLEDLRTCLTNLKSVNVSNTKQRMKDSIDSAYNTILAVLNDAAYRHVPRIKANVLKFWWDQELSDLKSKAMASNKLWIEAGRPRSGYIFDVRKADKYKYKCLIKRKQLEIRNNITNNLHDALVQKDTEDFWKVWKSKFPNKKVNKFPLIDGSSDPNIIANKFADYFSNVCTSEPLAYKTANNDFLNRLQDYMGDSTSNKDIVSVELLEEVLESMSRGKAAGLDNITIEHIQFAHPIIITILKELFNCFLEVRMVPDGFRDGLAIPLPKNDNASHNVNVDNFRCITISPVISKLFEHCLLRLFSKYFHSNDAQLGFKKKLGCSHAIYSVKQVVDYYVRGGSTVNICTIDISKAFDKVNLFILLGKLMDRNIPNCVINVLFDWFAKSYITVKWLNVLSLRCQVNSGVRQGGVMSPVLFAIYVDEILVKLNNSGLGCNVKGLTVNSFMYADDLIILSASVTHLQKLINICVDELNSIQLSVNAKKCFCMRIGKRYAVSCKSVVIDNYHVQWTNEIRYLGVYFTAGHLLKFNFVPYKRRFFRCLNCILSKTGTKAINVVLSLTQSYCVPFLLYAVESTSLTATEKLRLASPFKRLFSRLFNSFDAQTIAYCQYYTGYLPLEFVIDQRRLKFLNNICNLNNVVIQSLFRLNGDTEISSLVAKYNTNMFDIKSINYSMWNSFIIMNNLSVE